MKSFSQLRNDFAETDTFYLSGGGQTTVRGTRVTTDTAFRTLEDRKLDKIMRRYNSEPTLPGQFAYTGMLLVFMTGGVFHGGRIGLTEVIWKVKLCTECVSYEEIMKPEAHVDVV